MAQESIKRYTWNKIGHWGKTPKSPKPKPKRYSYKSTPWVKWQILSSFYLFIASEDLECLKMLRTQKAEGPHEEECIEQGMLGHKEVKFLLFTFAHLFFRKLAFFLFHLPIPPFLYSFLWMNLTYLIKILINYRLKENRNCFVFITVSGAEQVNKHVSSMNW